MLRADAQRSRWIWLIALLGFALRIYGLGDESFWLDEVTTANRVYEPLGQLLFGWDSETQGPLYYVFIKGWGLLFGNGEWTLRIWSVIFGTLTIPAVYYLGRHLFSGTGAMLAALFTAVHPFAIHYSQEARPYALFLLLATVSFYLVMKLLRQFRWPIAWSYLLITSAAFYTHAFGAFLILSHVLMFLWFRRADRFRGAARYPRPFVYTLLLLSLFCLPELAQNVLAAVSKLNGTSPAGWIPKPTVWDLFKLPAEYFMDARVGYVILPIVFLLAAFRALSEPQLRFGIQWLVLMAISFWVLPWLISVTVTPLFVLRYASPGLLIILCLMATASASLQALPRRMFVVALLILTMSPLLNYYTKVDKDPWRQTAEHLSARVKPGDVVLTYPGFTTAACLFYLPESVKSQVLQVDDLPTFAKALSGAERIWRVESYDVKRPHDISQLEYLKRWSTEIRRVGMNDILPMNPHRFWSAPIKITLSAHNRPVFGPPLPLTPNS
ncbi:glycosyltransferase family 39 protein [bacterium]|nr:glycosyltransferase family 39 protein [bacterium]